MGILRRLILIAKGYLSLSTEQLDKVASEEQQREEAARKKALFELQEFSSSGIESRRQSGNSPTSPSTRTITVANKLAADYRLLGVREDADLQTVETAWRELARRADPKRFPSGSTEEKKAAEILSSINSAYARIRESINPTEGRFGQLEL